MQNNLPARTQRFSESAQVWTEIFTGAQGSLEIQKYSTVRVRATGATTVSFDGLLSATMSSGEIMYFNAGIGNVNNTKKTVTVTIGGANAFVQVGALVEKFASIAPPWPAV